MRRSYGYQQQSYEMQEVQEQSYVMNQQETWQSKNQFHNQHSSGMEIMPTPRIDSQLLKRQNKFRHGQDMHQNGWQETSGMEIMPTPCIDSQVLKRQNKFRHGQDMHQNGWQETSAYYNHVSGGGKRFSPPRLNGFNANSQFSHGHVMLDNEMEENVEYETYHHQVPVPATTVRVHEIRYVDSGWGDNNLHHRGSYEENIKLKQNGCWKAEWVSKGL